MNNRKEVSPEYIYLTVPAEYVCVYHRIMAMLADYGEEMLKDCKASCTDRNSGVIECFNMFNAACAARLLGQDKKAELIINYVKAKINQIYKGNDNSTSYVFPIDENGKLKAFVSCNDRPRFWINEEEDLMKQNQGLGFEETYSLDDENGEDSYVYPFDFDCEASFVNGRILAEQTYYVNGNPLPSYEYNNVKVEYYVDERYVPNLSEHEITNPTSVKLRVSCYYKGGTMTHNYVISTYKDETTD